MTVRELIRKLELLPPDAEVYYAWDGGARSEAAHVYQARGGHVVIADENEVLYSAQDRPPGAPDEKGDPYWETPTIS